MALLKESFLLSATDADILAAPSRLAAIPSQGTLTIEATATDLDTTNFGVLTVQLPNGDIPLSNVHIPWCGDLSTDLKMDTNTELMVVVEVAQGGHVLLQYTEAGALSVLIYVTLNF